MSKRVVILDDEEGLCKLWSNWFQGEGWEVHAITDGQRLEELTETTRPHLLLIDVLLPDSDGDGLQLARRIKEKYSPQSPKIIVTSAIYKNYDLANLTNRVLDGFIEKPFNRDNLMALVKEVLAPGKKTNHPLPDSDHNMSPPQEDLSETCIFKETKPHFT